MNLKIFSSTRKYSDTKWEEFKAKNIILEYTKSTKNHYLFSMVKDLFQMMAFICRLIFIKIYENRFTQIKTIEEILIDKGDSKDPH